MANQFGDKIKQLREKQNLLQRQVASLLEIDTPLFSKIERGERTAKKEIIKLLAKILKANTEELITLWLADQVFDVVKYEDMADQALKRVAGEIKKTNKKQNDINGK